jgi:hypothetical protein
LAPNLFSAPRPQSGIVSWNFQHQDLDLQGVIHSFIP